MARYLFVTWAGGGNEPPAIGLAQELRERGHVVAFAGQQLGRGPWRVSGYGFRDPLAAAVPVLATFLVHAFPITIWHTECQETARTRKVARTGAGDGRVGARPSPGRVW